MATCIFSMLEFNSDQSDSAATLLPSNSETCGTMGSATAEIKTHRTTNRDKLPITHLLSLCCHQIKQSRLNRQVWQDWPSSHQYCVIAVGGRGPLPWHGSFLHRQLGCEWAQREPSQLLHFRQL